jgi:hypothetical protein
MKVLCVAASKSRLCIRRVVSCTDERSLALPEALQMSVSCSDPKV